MPKNIKGGVTPSSLEFINYRIIQLEFKCGPLLDFSPTGLKDKTKLEIGVGVSDITYKKESDSYLVPLAAEMKAIASSSKEQIFSSKSTIVGLFRFIDAEDLDDETRQKIILNQTAAILMPFLRAAISGAIAMAGFGAMPFPLMNMTKLAEQPNRKIIIEDESSE